MYCRFCVPQGKEYTANFRLLYQRSDGERWIDYQNKHGEKVRGIIIIIIIIVIKKIL